MLELVDHHRVAPLVWRGLDHGGRARMPGPVRDGMEERVRRYQVRALGQTSALLRLLGDLDAQGVRVLPLKGPALSQLLYGDISVRQAGADLDLLVERGAVDVAESVLLARGYRRRRPAFGLSPRQRSVYDRVEKDFGYIHPRTGTQVDLHWRWVRQPGLFPVTFDQALARSVPVVLGGRDVPFLGGADLLVYLCVHGAKHGWFRLKWLTDLPPLLRSADPDVLAARARELGLTRVVASSLCLAGELLGSRVPRWASAVSAADRGCHALRVTSASAVVRCCAPKRRRHLYSLSPRVGYKLRAVTIDLAQPADWGTLRLPNSLLPFYIPLRPVLYGVRWLRGRGPGRAAP